MKIENAEILVTGANRGIGRALVELALAQGAAKVYAAARDTAQLAGLQALHGARLVLLTIDVTDAAQIAAAAAKVPALDLLINNAGALAFAGMVSGELSDIRRDMDTNFYGTLGVTRAFLPAVEKKQGAIANLLTVVALASMPALGGYSASKAAALSLTQALRGELGKKGLKVHAVFPGPVDTEMAKAITLPKTSPQDVAKAIFAGIEKGDEDIFPDPMAAQVGGAWAKGPKDVEKMFAGM